MYQKTCFLGTKWAIEFPTKAPTRLECSIRTQYPDKCFDGRYLALWFRIPTDNHLIRVEFCKPVCRSKWSQIKKCNPVHKKMGLSKEKWLGQDHTQPPHNFKILLFRCQWPRGLIIFLNSLHRSICTHYNS